MITAMAILLIVLTLMAFAIVCAAVGGLITMAIIRRERRRGQ